MSKTARHAAGPSANPVATARFKETTGEGAIRSRCAYSSAMPCQSTASDDAAEACANAIIAWIRYGPASTIAPRRCSSAPNASHAGIEAAHSSGVGSRSCGGL